MLLINPSYNRKQKLGGFSRYVPLSVPIGIGSIAGYLLKNGKKVMVVDEEIEEIRDDSLDTYVKGLDSPYIFGISCLTASISRGYDLAAKIKVRYPDSKVIFGNIHPTVLPEEVLSNRNVDIVVRGEGEETLDLLYDRIKKREGYSDVKGISYRDGDRIVHTEPAELPDLAKMPKFRYELFEGNAGKYNLGFVASSRGCPYNCIFCSQRSISGRKYRFFSSDIVIDSIDELINEYKQSFITFVDDSFLMNKKRVIELCEMMIKKGFHQKAIFDCQARSDTVDDEVLKILREAGFRTIHFGIETASERIMRLIDKKETVEEVKQGIMLAKKHGFQVSGTFILGLPTETKEERHAAYRLAKELDLEYVRFNNATPYPGTKLYEIALEEKRFNPGDNWSNLNACGSLVTSPFKDTPLAYIPLTATKEELQHEILKYNLYYSFRPARILKILKEKVGPAGWLALPERWYLSWREWAYLSQFGFNISCSFLKTWLYDLALLFPWRKKRG